jgi:diacylglycerol kinase family enzyme
VPIRATRALTFAAVAAASIAAARQVRRVVLPARPDGAPSPVPVRLPDPDARPSPDGAGLRVAVNPSSGPAWTVAPTDALREALPAAEVVELSEHDDLAEVLGGTDLVALGIAGGDGTVSAAARLAADRDLPLVVVPAGTLNHLARDLGVADLADTVAAVRAGTATHMDLGTVADRTFVNTLAFGGYPELVDARERLEQHLGKWPALVVALVRELPRLEPLRLEVDGRPERVWLAWIGNGRYDPSGFAPSWRPRLDDGLLDIRIVDGSRRWSRARLLAHVLTGRLASCPVYEQRLAPSVRIRSLDGPLRLAVDGETFDAPDEVEVAKRPRALTVAVPPTPAS